MFRYKITLQGEYKRRVIKCYELSEVLRTGKMSLPVNVSL